MLPGLPPTHQRPSRPLPRWSGARAPGLVLGLSLGLAPVLSTAADAPAYAARGHCAGYPRLALTVPEGWCVGLVADARDGLRMPRRLLEVAPGRFWITDMGGWDPGRGRLLELDIRGQAGDPGRLRVLARELDRPHGLVRGPDGQVYIGEAGRVWRTPATAVRPQQVLAGLPSDGAHPLKELVFGQNGRLYLNLGSSSDACRDERQQQPLPCPETVGPRPRAAVYEAVPDAAGGPWPAPRPYAGGLRNSLGLAFTRNLRTGAERLWQAENSVDYSDAGLPAEELNELTPGSDHGWPYCVTDAKGRSVAARGYEGRAACARAPHRAPHLTWPAHVAPLQLLAVPPAAPGTAATPWAGRLLAVWHGYRAQGQRIVGWRLGDDGAPQGAREDLVAGWSARAGVRPLGTPAGVTVDHRGWLWIVEDRNRTVLVVAPLGASAVAQGPQVRPADGTPIGRSVAK